VKSVLKKIGIVVALIASSAAHANYQQGQALFQRGDFAGAAAAYFAAYSAKKSAQEVIWSEWGLAQSLQKLGFLYSASKYYSVIVRRGPGANNPYFRKAFEELGSINNTVSIGQSHIVQLFKTKIDAAAIPGPARGFYFYYLGVEAFNEKKFEIAAGYFKRVPQNSPYYLKAQFHLGVVANRSGSHARALRYFESVRAGAGNSEDENKWLLENTNLNIARVYYETKRFREALQYYAQIPRESDNWLEAIFESSWGFFLMQKHNNTLGNIHTLHSPFFDRRFYPESYILQAITYLRLCRYDEVKKSMVQFRDRYKPVFQDMKNLLSQANNPRDFFKIIYDYRVGSLNKYKDIWEILDALSRSDFYKEAGNTIRFSDNEIARLSQQKGRWASSGLAEELSDFLSKKKALAISDSGRRLVEKARGYYGYLKELSDQTQLINAELVLGRVDAFRKQLNVGTAEARAQFIGGLQALVVGEELEYWPFEGEYWEDELGHYVYNIDSKCGSSKEPAKDGK